MDVSPTGDWSRVKVWYDPVRDLGTPPTRPTASSIRTPAQNASSAAKAAALTVAQTTMTHVAAAVQSPTGTPVQALAKDTTDRIASLIQSVMGGGSQDNAGG